MFKQDKDAGYKLEKNWQATPFYVKHKMVQPKKAVREWLHGLTVQLLRGGFPT